MAHIKRILANVWGNCKGNSKRTRKKKQQQHTSIINFIGLHFNFHEVIYIINAIAYHLLDYEMAFGDIVVVELTKTTIVMDTKRLTLPTVI